MTVTVKKFSSMQNKNKVQVRVSGKAVQFNKSCMYSLHTKINCEHIHVRLTLKIHFR